MDYILSPKLANKYYCETCDYKCCKHSDYVKHLSTRKHQNGSKMIVNDNDGLAPLSSKEFKCECGKLYKWDSGYYRHRKTCSIAQGDKVENNKSSSEFEIDKDLLIKMLLKNQDIMENVILKNQDVMEKMMEIMPKLSNQLSYNKNMCNM